MPKLKCYECGCEKDAWLFSPHNIYHGQPVCDCCVDNWYHTNEDGELERDEDAPGWPAGVPTWTRCYS